MARVPTLETFDNSIDLALKKIRSNSEDLRERHFVDRMYVEVNHKDDRYKTVSHCFKANNLYLRITDGITVEGKWYLPAQDHYDRITINYTDGAGSFIVSFDKAFIGKNYCLIFERHGNAIQRDETKYIALLDENYYRKSSTIWEDYINYLYEDGQSFKLFEKVVMVVCAIVLTGLAIAFYDHFTGQNWF
jgi:hypothetical protein